MYDIGIDAISFYTSNYYLDLAALAEARMVDVNKFHIGLGQYKMSVLAPDEDAVTLGANAVLRLKSQVDLDAVNTVLFTTETGIDQSKASGIYLHRLLSLNKRCRVIELKQACYSSTAALQMAVGLVQRDPSSKVLVVASDISRYELGSAAESSQGCGASAFLITANPRILTVTKGCGLYTEDVMDFWRPNYLNFAIVDGKFSTQMYMTGLEESWWHYQEVTGLSFKDHNFFCYHTPFARLAEKAHNKLAEINNISQSDVQISEQIQPALDYNRVIGNSYTASLYIAFLSLLDNSTQVSEGSRVGFYSYGSGCVAEYFSGILNAQYKDILTSGDNQQLLSNRTNLSFELYHKWYSMNLPEDGSDFTLPEINNTGYFRFVGVKDHKRVYTEGT